MNGASVGGRAVAVRPASQPWLVQRLKAASARRRWYYRQIQIASSELPRYQEALTPPLDVRGGYFSVSDRPGLGHDLREDYLSQAIPS